MYLGVTSRKTTRVRKVLVLAHRLTLEMHQGCQAVILSGHFPSSEFERHNITLPKTIRSVRKDEKASSGSEVQCIGDSDALFGH